MKLLRQLYTLFLVGLLPATLLSAGTVYLVLGSDTAIWNGMSVSRYNCSYDLSLYTDPLENAYAVMDPTFRSQFVDSYGQTMKMTWWMMAGNIFRYATNTNVPVPNIMTLYLMQKYHGENVLINGDELSLHYHTFFWSDYDQDGIYYWNQALEFEESRDDFDATLAQFLLEENVFPVSFRSGWHYMDNTWQHYLNELLPYSMHNAWPVNHVDLEEPLDNNYNWSESPSAFVPFHPALENYMVPGDGPGWNVRSASFQQVIRDDLMDTVFAHASQGTDQVACFWAHLPETDFPDNMARMGQLAHAAAAKYPDVDFRYCTAIEAMQRWRETSDTSEPAITLAEKGTPDERYYTISSDEPLFMPQPFVAAKFKDESYQVIDCEQISENTWRTQTIPYPTELVKLAVAATDSAGNLTTSFHTIIPDDIYIDNTDAAYQEITGNFSTIAETAWGTDARLAQVDADHPLQVVWSPEVPEQTYYHLFIQVPAMESAACDLNFMIHSVSRTDTVALVAPLPGREWIYLGTPLLEAGANPIIELFSDLPDSVTSASVPLDVVKLSAMVRDRDIRVSTNVINFGEVGLEQLSGRMLEIRNQGLENLTIQNITSSNGFIDIDPGSPFVMSRMGQKTLTLNLYPTRLGQLSDTLSIYSDDPIKPKLDIIITADVQYPFVVIDNEDNSNYFEIGEWFTSVAQIWGNSSRYAWLNRGASAGFSVILDHAGAYDLQEIVPKTVNATDSALYVIKIDGLAIDSVFQDQNSGSGQWVSLGHYYFPQDVEIELEVHDTGLSTVGAVLRTDAVKFQMLSPTTIDPDQSAGLMPGEPSLQQNFPNPFNPATTIRYSLPRDARITLEIFDMLGHEILSMEAFKPAGTYEFQWHGLDRSGNQVATGIYYCRLAAGLYSETIKMVYLR